MASRGGSGGHHGCRPGATQAHLVHVHGHVEAMNEMRAGDHAMKMPGTHEARRIDVPHSPPHPAGPRSEMGSKRWC